MKIISKLFEIVMTFLISGGIIAGLIDKKQRKNSFHKPYGIYEAHFKRPFDFICGMLAIICFGWLYVILAILVKFKLGSPIIFKQDRPGKDEKIFKLYKFRSMTDERNKKGELLPDEMRLTKFGKLLRATSLDELPEAFNIVKGDMSLIGPRPLLVKYLPYYTNEEQHRHDVRPGLSGLAQTHGRNFLDWDERFVLDVEYVNNITFLGDLKIILLTVNKILSHSDIASVGRYTMQNLDDERKNINDD